ncbi:hypothetical protein NW754_015373 [Fusarium falciforme]|nr:hypothetical protein NW754_015373 [Fusarium falciforme]
MFRPASMPGHLNRTPLDPNFNTSMPPGEAQLATQASALSDLDRQPELDCLLAHAYVPATDTTVQEQENRGTAAMGS